MARTRVLVVDDSALVRAQLAGWIGSDSGLAVAATAANGRQAVEKFDALHPDAVVLDVEMPVMDGIETLRQLRARDDRVPIIMFSTLTGRGGEAALEALSAGATDCLVKPTTMGDVRVSAEEVRVALIERLHGLRPPAGPVSPTTARPRSRPKQARVDLVAIGASTGGPNALEAVFSRLPPDLDAPVVVVQHMPPVFTAYLAQRLARVCPLRVAEAASGVRPQPGEAWVAPGGLHLVVERDGAGPTLATNDEPPVNACRPSVDVLFASVAKVYGEHALAVVLTGMGHDGLAGAERIQQAGGRVLVQDESSSIVWSMPGSVAKAGLADEILPPAEIADQIVARVRGRPAGARQAHP